MAQLSSTLSKQRSERRIAVRLPLMVRGRDRRGIVFEEETSSENLCRNGAAFVTRFDIPIGTDVEIHIPLSHNASRRTGRFAGAGSAGRFAGARNIDRFADARASDTDFATHGRVVHVGNLPNEGERLIGVQFTGPRFQRVFRSESAA